MEFMHEISQVEALQARAELPPSPIFDAAAFDAELDAGASPLPLFREALRAGDLALRQQFREGMPASKLVSQRSRLIDRLLRRAWQRFFPPQATDIALVAVGGYGRGELHPSSDIDLMILLSGQDHHAHQR
jgi:UTP:GlnB (protein PII) uridylyltransferase